MIRPILGGERLEQMRELVAGNLSTLLADPNYRRSLERYAIGLGGNEHYVRSAVTMLLCADALMGVSLEDEQSIRPLGEPQKIERWADVATADGRHKTIEDDDVESAWEVDVAMHVRVAVYAADKDEAQQLGEERVRMLAQGMRRDGDLKVEGVDWCDAEEVSS